jgi:DNA-binding response OmpR family regulator
MKTILVVEDNLGIAAFLRDVLSDEGYAVQAAFSCREAMTRLQMSRPALILCDLMLPDGSGETIGRYVEGWPVAPPLVLMSAGEAPFTTAQSWYRAYLPKPFEIVHLLDVVETLIGASS